MKQVLKNCYVYFFNGYNLKYHDREYLTNQYEIYSYKNWCYTMWYESWLKP